GNGQHLPHRSGAQLPHQGAPRPRAVRAAGDHQRLQPAGRRGDRRGGPDRGRLRAADGQQHPRRALPGEGAAAVQSVHHTTGGGSELHQGSELREGGGRGRLPDAPHVPGVDRTPLLIPLLLALWSAEVPPADHAAVPAVVDRPAMAAKVRVELLHSWHAYEKYAWGHDELRPLSKQPRDWYGEPLLMTPVDSLDALLLMGLHDE